ncbi:MAG TPA: hypothetical protein VGJ20_07860 [Xanthobacteraceae bacterium]|jgi:hypothetical protein
MLEPRLVRQNSRAGVAAVIRDDYEIEPEEIDVAAVKWLRLNPPDEPSFSPFRDTSALYGSSPLRQWFCEWGGEPPGV